MRESVESNPKATLRSERSSAARNGQVADSERAPQMANIFVTDLWNKEFVIMRQEATNLSVTDQHAKHLRVSGEDDKLLHDNDRLHITLLGV